MTFVICYYNCSCDYYYSIVAVTVGPLNVVCKDDSINPNVVVAVTLAVIATVFMYCYCWSSLTDSHYCCIHHYSLSDTLTVILQLMLTVVPSTINFCITVQIIPAVTIILFLLQILLLLLIAVAA